LEEPRGLRSTASLLANTTLSIKIQEERLHGLLPSMKKRRKKEDESRRCLETRWNLELEGNCRVERNGKRNQLERTLGSANCEASCSLINSSGNVYSITLHLLLN